MNNDVAQHLAFSRRHGRRSGVTLAILVVAIFSVVALAVWDGLWPPRANRTGTTQASGPQG